jgi:hypothetical protein
MANWSEILNEIVATSTTPNKDFDGVRHKYLDQLFQLTDRNVIAIYSGWLQKQGLRNPFFSITDALIPGLMAAVNKLDKSKGLDLVLHTPGGEINATEQIVFYLRKAFKNDIRAIVPQLAMSAGAIGTFIKLQITGLPLATICLTILFALLGLLSGLQSPFYDLAKLTLGAFIGSYVQRQGDTLRVPTPTTPVMPPGGQPPRP